MVNQVSSYFPKRWQWWSFIVQKINPLFINVILLFVEEGLPLSIYTTIMRTSCVKQITVRHGGHGGDAKRINLLTLLLSIEWFLFIHLILLFAMNNDTIVNPLDLFGPVLNFPYMQMSY